MIRLDAARPDVTLIDLIDNARGLLKYHCTLNFKKEMRAASQTGGIQKFDKKKPFHPLS